eukprot:3111321-Amphidinium_carterae.1
MNIYNGKVLRSHFGSRQRFTLHSVMSPGQTFLLGLLAKSKSSRGVQHGRAPYETIACYGQVC